MLYVFHGTDVAQAGVKARALVAQLRAKKPDASYDKIDGDNWNPAALEEHLGGQGLFASKYIIFLDRVSENAEAKDALGDFIPAMQESPNIFIMFEGKVSAELGRAITKSAEKVVECEAKKKPAFGPDAGFNIFSLADAVGKRDAGRAWMLYRKAIDNAIEPEAVVGMLFWKAKTMGMRDLARKLVTLYHDGHRGLVDMELATERFVLSLRP